jgi:A/G-specific adenine glycosylase
MTNLPKFRRSIVEWFRNDARDLPWRETSDPYKIWVSEIMLQQTTVATVVPYYKRFIKKFPTLKALSKSKEEEVLQLWEGLGYYRRAKNLRAGAQLIVNEFKSEFPQTREDILKVPGIGEYSAGSILGIAFRKPEAALDGNLIRVYSRFYSIEGFVNETSTLKKLWEIARQHVPAEAENIREFTEGMMELGARICTPKKFDCSKCPLKWGCKARKNDLVATLPRKKSAKLREKHFESIFLVKRRNKFGVQKKGADKKYPDFCRLPYKAITSKQAPKKYLAKMKYSVTHRDFTVFVTDSKKIEDKNLRWLTKKDLGAVLLPAIDRKIVNKFAS